jgi:hypothetical protein
VAEFDPLLQVVTGRWAYFRGVHGTASSQALSTPRSMRQRSDLIPDDVFARLLAVCWRTVALATSAVITLSACAHDTLPDDPFSSQGTALSMVPINHADRYAVDIFVDKYWAGNVTRHAGGGAAACCYPGLKDWRQPVIVRWTWGWEEDPKTKAVTMSDEPHKVVTHFPASGPHNDPDPYKADAYVCVILRDLNTAELAFSPNRSGCADK